MKKANPLVPVTVLCLLTGSSAWAGGVTTPAAAPTCDDLPDCRDHATKGYRASQDGKNAEALQHFLLANAMAPNASLMYNIGLMHYALQQPDLARRWYKAAQVTADPKDKKLARFLTIARSQLPPPPHLLGITTSTPSATSPAPLNPPIPEPDSRIVVPAESAPRGTLPDTPQTPAGTGVMINTLNVRDSVLCLGQGCSASATRPPWLGWVIGSAAGGAALIVGMALAIRYGAYPDSPSYIGNYSWH